MARTDGLLHSKLPPDARVNVRDTNAPIKAQDVEQFSAEFVATGLLHLREALGDIARHAENRSHPVDEYNTVPLTGIASESVLSLPPTYEYMPEKIESVLIGGPPSTQITLILGDRQWAVTIPAAGILPIGPLGIILGRSDPRMLVAATPGTYFLELMGIADRRFSI